MFEWKAQTKIKAVGLATVSAIVLSASTALADEVWVYNWSDYIDYDLFEKFEQETGIDIIYETYDSSEELEREVLAGGSRYDVVVPTDIFMQRQIEGGFFQKLDPEKLPNYGNLWQVVLDRTARYDPDNAYSVNYMWGTTGVGFNVNKVAELLGDDAPTDSLALIFDPANMEKLAECGVSFIDSPSEVIAATLQYLGEDPNSKDTEVLELVLPVFEAIRPYIAQFESGSYDEQLANGEICVAFGYSGDIFFALDTALELENGVEIEYSIPVEGALMWFDQMVVPANAPHPDAAHVFINFMMDPQNMADASNYVYYANGNLASQELLEEDVIGDPAIYPDADTLANLYTIDPFDEREQRVVTRIWNQIIAAN